ncbi:MAG: FtsX-like permease family protein [Candidatus Gastranaerophilales bacterium]|nr:FtsX-like permease family protein [Candidatus Gastranaerophilales bacterium]
MKRSALGKSTVREIRQSFGRFFAIMAIIALGVGLFAGLKVSKTAMVLTGEAYFERTQFYDYRLISTLGYEEEDVAFLRQQENVRAAEGALTFDVLYEDVSGKEGVVKVHSLTQDVNQVQLLEGRMPQEGYECVADAKLFDASAIGSSIFLSEGNAEEDLEHFAYREYTITGVVKSPIYVQFERGNTSLGVGSVSGFVYLLPEGFAEDYYTEVYVKFDADFPLYSEAYDSYMEEIEAAWETRAEQAADGRFERIVADAEEELADAEETFAEEKADAEAELADARRELADAAEQLADGERQIEDARQELLDGRKTLAESEIELADARELIAEKERELADGERELADGIEQAEAGDRELAAGEKELNEGRTLLEEQRAVIDAQEKVLLQGEAELAAAEAEVSAAEAQLAEAEQSLKEVEALLAQMEAMPPDMQDANMIAALTAQIAAGRASVEEGYAQLAAPRQELAASRATLEAGKAALADGKAQIAAYQAQLDEGQAQLDEGRKDLSAAWREIQKGQEEIAEGRAALADARQELADGERQLADARKELADGERQLADAREELADARQEYADGQKEYEEALLEFDEQIAEAEEELADARQEIADLKEPDVFVLGRDTNVGYVCFESDSSIVDGIANVLPVFFFLVSALVCMTTMSRMVEEQRTQIGVLKALGYGEGAILSKYMVYSGTGAVTGCVFGFVVGTWLMPWVIWKCYGMMYLMDDIVYVFDWKLAGISLAASVCCSMGVTYVCCRRELALAAAELMRPKAPKAGKRIFMEYLPFIWKRLSFLRKVSLRNIFRYKKRLFMMVIGISGCTALLVTGFGLKDSIAHVADKQYGEIQVYDAEVIFSDPVEEDMRAAIADSVGENLEDALWVMESSVDVVSENGMKSITLVVSDFGRDVSAFLRFAALDGEACAYPEIGEGIITHRIAENLGVQVGDTIRLQNEDMESIEVTISGICQNYIYNYVYVGEGTYEEQMGRAPEYKTAFVNVAEGVDVHTVSAVFMGMEDVASVTVSQDVRERVSTMMKSMNLIVAVIILCGAGLAFIVLYNLTNINITERIREIATVKVLGFYKNETASYVFRENILLTFMGALAGLVLGRYLHLFVMSQINIDMMAFDVNIHFSSYLYSVILTFVFAWAVNRFMRIKLDHVSMTESLKSVD